VVIPRRYGPDLCSFPYTSTQNLKSLPIIDPRTSWLEFADCRYWKIVAFFAPLLGAALVAGYLVKDHHHSWYDCLAGAIIGATVGYGQFRTSYFGGWDYTVNHIPLPREGLPLTEGEVGYVCQTNRRSFSFAVLNESGGRYIRALRSQS
jgi:membrane-associated phospholipid phosphatase